MNEIFTHFISRDRSDDKVRLGYELWFTETFPAMEFKGEEAIMYDYTLYSATIGVPMKYEYFNTYLSTELKPLLRKRGIRVPGTDGLNYDEPTGIETAYIVAKELMQNEFRILESYDSDIKDFRVAAAAFISNKLNTRLVEELSRSYETLSSTNDAGATTEYTLDNLIMLKDIYNEESLEELDDGDESSNGEFEFITDCGIPVIDEDIGGLYTCQLIGIEAQPGTGKTRFTLGSWVYRTAVVYKRNVIYYQLEQSRKEAIAMLVARHVFTLYNIIITDAMILRNKVPEEYRSKVKAAEIDLFESGKYGKIFIRHGDLYWNTITQTFKKDDKLHGPFDVIAIDYMGLIEQKPSKFEKELLDYQVIAKSFRKFKRYVERNNKAGIAVSQFNDKGIEAGKNDKEITTNMAQGGITVYRNTDQNLALSRTKTMEAQQKLRISQPKIRGTAGFGSVVVDTRLGISYIYQSAQQQL